MQAGLAADEAAWVRLSGAALILVPVALAVRGRAGLVAVKGSWRTLLGYGLVGMAASQTLYFTAAQRLPVGVAILLQFSGPLLIIGWIRFVRRRRVPRSAVLGVVVSLVGLGVVVEVWAGITFDLVGVLAGIGSAACQAAYFLMIEGLSGMADVLLMTATGTAVASVALTFVVLPWTIPWQVISGPVSLGSAGVPGWLPVAWLVLISAIVAYLGEGAAVQRLSAVVGGAVAYVEVVFAALFAWVLLGERLGLPQVVGGAMVLVGAFVSQRPPAVADPLTVSHPELEILHNA
jgi:drug/metabolite transporter (DMT)-like permease